MCANVCEKIAKNNGEKYLWLDVCLCIYGLYVSCLAHQTIQKASSIFGLDSISMTLLNHIWWSSAVPLTPTKSAFLHFGGRKMAFTKRACDTL